jgi:histidine triad (HIT) family protein
MADCLFCKIAKREIPSEIVFEDEETVAFRDIKPMAPLHVLVIPKEHVASIAEADPATIGRLGRTAAAIARDAGYAEKGYRVVANIGADAGQTVRHLHFHVLAGRHLGWPPG